MCANALLITDLRSAQSSKGAGQAESELMETALDGHWTAKAGGKGAGKGMNYLW